MNAFMENETEANLYAARCLVICAFLCAAAWLLTVFRIFILPLEIVNPTMPVIIFFFLIPALICRRTGGKKGWVKYAILFCSVMGIFILSSAMPKHGVMAWTMPLMLSCHYYSKKLSRMTLIASQILFSASIYIGMFVGEWDQILLDAAYYS